MMAIKKLCLATILFFGVVINALAQQEIKIGDKIPDLVITGIINQPKSTVQLKDLYKGGLLIIDFWFTSCVPCIREIKLLDSLKVSHPDRFNVLMVGYEDSTKIKNFLGRKNNTNLKTSNLILATGDTLLKKRFPHKVAPHNVWIDKDGIVRAITGTEEVTAENILRFSGRKMDRRLKTKIDNFKFDPVQEFHEGDTSYVYRSIITPYIEGIDEGTIVKVGNPGSGYRRFSAYNTALIFIYWQAYSGFVSGTRQQLIETHTKDSLRIFSPNVHKHLLKYKTFKNIDQYKQDYTYNYSITLPKDVTADIMKDYIFNDLERQFNIKAKIELRPTNCIIVTKNEGLPLKESVQKSLKPSIKKIGLSKIQIRNAKIGDILDFIWRTYDRRQVVDPFITEVKSLADVSFDLDLDFSGAVNVKNPSLPPDVLYNELKKYGYQFKKDVRQYPKLILYDL